MAGGNGIFCLYCCVRDIYMYARLFYVFVPSRETGVAAVFYVWTRAGALCLTKIHSQNVQTGRVCSICVMRLYESSIARWAAGD